MSVAAPGWSILALNGWAQPHDGLRELLPDATDHVPYSDAGNIDILLRALADKTPDLVVGWSLGGQLAARAVMDGVIRPKALVLIGAPWRFVANAQFPSGMGPSTYAMFVENYAKNPERTAKRFGALIAQGDVHAERIQAKMLMHLSTMSDGERWLYWLKLLDAWEPDADAVSLLPPTLLIHGQNDGIVPFAQSDVWMRHLPRAKRIALPDCGHAPHLHDAVRVRQSIVDFMAEVG